MRSYKELLKVKVSDMTGEELTMFNRVNATIKDTKEISAAGMIAKGVKGFFSAMGDAGKTLAVHQLQQDRVSRIKEIKTELSDLEEASDAGAITSSKYNLIKAKLEVELEGL
jgi:hypothetical protein